MRAFRALSVAALAAGAAVSGLVPAAALPPRNPVRCVATDARRTCSYSAAGPGVFASTRLGGWVVRVYRDGALVWSDGGQTPRPGWIPSIAGDRVEAAVFAATNFCPPPQGVPLPPCGGAGAVIAGDDPE